MKFAINALNAITLLFIGLITYGAFFNPEVANESGGMAFAAWFVALLIIAIFYKILKWILTMVCSLAGAAESKVNSLTKQENE